MKIDELKGLFLKRSSHRKYENSPIPDEEVMTMIDAARIAPSAHNLQPWRFLAIKRRALIEEIADVAVGEYRKLLQGLTEEAAEGPKKFEFFVDHFRNAPLIFAVLSKKSEFDTENVLKTHGVSVPMTRCVDIDSLGVGAVIENLLLSAEVMGYGTCWVAAPVMYAQEKVEKLLGVEEPWHFVSLVSVTRPVRERKSAPKKPLDDILTIVS